MTSKRSFGSGNQSMPQISESDETAETAVRDAIRTLVESGKPAYSLSVPFAAEKILVATSGGSLDYAEANEKVTWAIVAMVKRGELEASLEGRYDWKLLS